MLVDVGEQAFVARAEQDHVMRDTWPGPLDAEMDEEQAGTPALAGERIGAARAALMARRAGRDSCA